MSGPTFERMLSTMSEQRLAIQQRTAVLWCVVWAVLSIGSLGLLAIPESDLNGPNVVGVGGTQFQRLKAGRPYTLAEVNAGPPFALSLRPSEEWTLPLAGTLAVQREYRIAPTWLMSNLSHGVVPTLDPVLMHETLRLNHARLAPLSIDEIRTLLAGGQVSKFVWLERAWRCLFVMLLLGYFGALAVRQGIRARRFHVAIAFRRRFHCPACGYDAVGLHRCPECGFAMTLLGPAPSAAPRVESPGGQ